MAENMQYTGRLGLESRDGGTLSAAVAAVVDTLEDFGHPAETIEARAENTAKLQCDHYLIAIRLRRVPLRRASKLAGNVMQPSALLEVSLSPLYAGYCDREISELLLAEMLRRLLPSVEATSVEWLETDVALTCEQFLRAFDPQHAAQAQTAAAPAAAVTDAQGETGTDRPRGRERFTPVEETALELEAHFDRALEDARICNSAGPAARRQPPRKPVAAAFSISGLGHQMRASALAAISMAGTRRLRFISHLLLLTALILYLESAGMVQAARPLVP